MNDDDFENKCLASSTRLEHGPLKPGVKGSIPLRGTNDSQCSLKVKQRTFSNGSFTWKHVNEHLPNSVKGNIKNMRDNAELNCRNA